MADQAVSNERKRELEQLDPFQEGLLKTVALVKAYKKQLLMAVAAVAVVTTVFAGIMYSFERAEKKAAILVSQALETYGEAGSPDKGFAAVEKDFQTLFTEYANTNAGRQARIQFAKICYDALKYDLSYQHYQEALELFKHEALMENLILAALGHVSLAKEDNEAAKEYFLKIEKGKSELLKDEARNALAMIYAAENDADKSRAMYEKIIAGSADSIYMSIAKSKTGTVK